MGKCYLQKYKLMKNIGFYILKHVQLKVGRINYNKKDTICRGLKKVIIDQQLCP